LFAVGIAITHFLWLRPSLILLALAPIAALCCLAAVRAQRILWLPIAAVWCLLGAWCAEMEPHPAPSPAIAPLSDGLLRTVEGTIVGAGPVRGEVEQNIEEPANEMPTQRIDLRASSIEMVTDDIDTQTAVDGGVRLTVRWPADAQRAPIAFRCGDEVRATVRLMLPENYRDPGAWSRTDYLLDQGITATATVNLDRIERLGARSDRAVACRISEWQQAASTRILALPQRMHRLRPWLRLTGDDAVMLAAMITGDRTFLTHSLRVGFERTGSFHMLVVSGLHLAIVAGCLFWIARRLRIPQIPATLLTITGSFAYALFTGFATPVQRSLWMVTLYMIGRLVYRERSPLNTIGFASLCLLAVSPRSLFESGLQMTLLAVISIGGVAMPLLQNTIHPYLAGVRDLRLVAIDVKLPPRIAQFRVTMRMIAEALQKATSSRIGWAVFPWVVQTLLRTVELVVVAIVVELAMTLPMALYFHRITVLALPVNILILPLLAVLLPMALMTLGILLIWPAAAVIPATVTAVILHIGVGLVHLFGSIALGDFRIPAPVLGQSMAFFGLLAAAIVLARRANTVNSRWQRLAAWAAVCLAAFAAVAPRPVDHPGNALLVEAIDVGQGDSLLLITPDGKTLLVDGGGFGGGPRQAPHHPKDEGQSKGAAEQEFDIGEEVVSQVLWSRGIRRLDAVALSHAHSDHMGGLPSILRNFKPKELWVGNNPRVAAYTALLDEADGLHVDVKTLRAGDALTLGTAQIKVLAPLSDYVPGAEPANNDSLVLHVAYGSVSVLLEGDAEGPIEQAMLGEPGLESALLKVGHHGSTTSTTPEFLARVAPRSAVISCGLHNRYGHPREEVLAALQSAKVRTYSTDINGAVCFQLDSKGVTADSSCGRDRTP
jgi:competence protein ComEC